MGIRFTSKSQAWLWAVVLLAFPLVLQSFGNAWVRIADMSLLYVMLALGLNVVVGYAGLLDLGYVAFFALGAYLKIPETILNAAPTDGLFGDSRTDEEQLGASYDELEWAMNALDSGKKTNDFTDRQKEVFEIFIRLNTQNKHKMDAIPVCFIPEEIK